MSADGDLRAHIQEKRNAFLDIISSGLAKFSVSPVLATAAAALWGVGHGRDSARLQFVGKRILLGIAIAQGTATIMKWSIDRRRPEESRGKDGWRDAEEEDQSFPSGHTVNCFIAATVISRSTESRAAAALSYAFATASAMGRLDRDKHWASDVLAGAVLGYGVGAALTWHGPGGGACDEEASERRLPVESADPRQPSRPRPRRAG